MDGHVTTDEIVETVLYTNRGQFNNLNAFKDYELFENRMKSFTGKWDEKDITALRMARAGFYYIGPDRRVKCAFCFTTFEEWSDNSEEDPTVIHKKKVPRCKYIIKFDDIYTPDRVFFFFQSVGVIPVLSLKTQYQHYIEFDNRLKTFDNYSMKNVVDVNAICEGGFFLTSDGYVETFTCFCCGKTFEFFMNGYNIWRLHAVIEPLCDYLLLKKGKEFVVDVLDGYCNLPEVNYEYFSSIKIHQKSDEIDRSLIPWNQKLKKRTRDLRSRFFKICKKQGSSTQDPIPNFLLCKICYKNIMEVLAMPCKHISACIQCAVSINFCAICRLPRKKLIRIYLEYDEKVVGTNALECGSTSAEVQTDKDIDRVLCLVCQKLEVQVVFILCRHTYCCLECVASLKRCLICRSKIIAFMNVYL